MYLPFVKFFATFIAFIIPVFLFYLTIKGKLNCGRKKILYWGLPIFFLILFVGIRYCTPLDMFENNIQWVNTWISWLFIAILSIFLIFVLFYWLDIFLNKFVLNKKVNFKYWIAIPFMALFLVSYIHGTINRKSLIVRYENVNLVSLPDKFEGTKIAVIGDTHLGSFKKDKEYIQRVVDLINKENVDVVIFTGDLVNTASLEVTPYIDILRGIKAKYGKYAVMGNHDFCGYYIWDNQHERDRQIALMKKAYTDIDFDLLDNNFVIWYKDSLDRICVIGVDEYSDVKQVLTKTPQGITKILINHNPNDWEKSVLNKERDIELTISGHTHAWQAGIELLGIKLSPAKMLFKRWDGLYSEGTQQIFVTRGLGYVGIPVRIGLKPEISILTLKKNI